MTEARNAYSASWMAVQRLVYRCLGLCLDCGKPRDSQFLRCAYCRAGRVIRVDRSKFRRKERYR